MKAELPSIRANYKQQTRTRILEAAAGLICEAGEDSVTIRSVAARAGVSDRTVYRHFETRDELVKAVWGGMVARVRFVSAPRTADELIAAPMVAFPRYEDEGELMQAYLHWQANHRARSNETSRKEMLKCVRSALPNLGEDKLRRRAAIADLLISVAAWDWMARRWGFDGTESGDAAAEALQALLGRRRAQ